MKITIASLVLLCVSLPLQISSFPQDRVLHVYGSSGPLEPFKECAGVFSRYHGVKVAVVGGPVSSWIAQAEKDADVIFGGAEYILTGITDSHPGLIDRGSRTTLHARAVGVLVRKGNPKNVKCLEDLTRGDMRLLAVNGASQLGLWEDAAGIQDFIHKIQRNIVVSVSTSEEAMGKWNSMPGLDAWLTYESWHYRMRDSTDLVQLPASERIYRGTPVAITRTSRDRELAQQFVAYLKTDPAHEIFRKWGWR